MTSIIYDKTNNRVSESRNLRGLSAKAKEFGGVSAIELRDNGTGGAFVSVRYANGYTGCTIFACLKMAVKWANNCSKRKNTWWTGCNVTHPVLNNENSLKAQNGNQLATN